MMVNCNIILWKNSVTTHVKYGTVLLVGHTHRGQMFPFMIVAYIANPFFYGHYEYAGKQVYVTQGTFFYGFPFRIGSHMEITLITLQSES